MVVLVIDNDDSFTYNLVQLIKSAGAEADVLGHRLLNSDSCTNYAKILFSPGPDLPDKYPALIRVLDQYKESKSILGICLGHQAIASYFGSKLTRLGKPIHGERALIKVSDSSGIYTGLPAEFNVGRYHSWTIGDVNNSDIEVTARDGFGNIMSIRHRVYDLQGVQYHPESYMSEFGIEIMKNWLMQK